MAQDWVPLDWQSSDVPQEPGFDPGIPLDAQVAEWPPKAWALPATIGADMAGIPAVERENAQERAQGSVPDGYTVSETESPAPPAITPDPFAIAMAPGGLPGGAPGGLPGGAPGGLPGGAPGGAALDLEVKRQATLSPEDFAAELAEREQRKADLADELALKQIRDSNQQAEDNATLLQTATNKTQTELSQIDQTAKALADKPIEANISTGRQIAGYVSAIIGGLLSANHGGRNDGLTLIANMIDQDIELQTRQRGQQLEALSGQRQTALQSAELAQEQYRVAESTRVAALHNVDRMLAAEQARLDPRGTAAARIVQARQGAQSMINAARAKQEETLYKRNVELSKLELELDKYKLDARVKTAKLSGAGSGKRDRDIITPKELRSLPPKVANEIIARGVRAGRGWLRNSDGTFAMGKSDGEAREIAVIMANVDSMNKMINKAIGIRNSAGQELGTLNSEELQAMESIHADIKAQANAVADLGALDAGSLQQIEAMVGKDLAGFYSNVTRLRTYQSNMQDKVNAQLHTKSTYDGKYVLDTVQAVPKRSIAEIRTELEQGPDEHGRIATAAERMTKAREDYEAVLHDVGDPERATRIMTNRGQNNLKRFDADLRGMRDALSAERPKDWDKLNHALDDAKAEYADIVADDDSTGEQLRAAEQRRNKAIEDLEQAKSPKAKTLEHSIEEQRKFVTQYRKFIDRGLSKFAEQAANLEQRANKAKQAIKRYEAGQAPSGARPGGY